MMWLHSRRMRILHVITRLIRGGAPRVVLGLCTGLASRGHEVHLATGTETGNEGSLLPEVRASGLPLHLVPELVREPRPTADIGALWRLRGIVRAGRFDVVHTHTSKAGTIGRLAAAGRAAIVHSPHGHIFDPQARIPGVHGHPLRAKLFYAIERVASLVTDRIVTLTALERQELIALGIARPSRCVPIHDAIDPGRVRDLAAAHATTRAAFGMAEGAPLIVTIGRLAAEKGHAYLIDALAGLDGVQLLVVGDGPERAALEARARALGLDRRVCFLGVREDALSILALADACALPSLYEGFGIVVLEAMALGVPVVASRTGGLPEVIRDGETGLLVPPADPRALAAALRSVLFDPDLARRVAHRAREAVHFSYDLPRMIDRVESLYDRVLAERRER